MRELSSLSRVPQLSSTGVCSKSRAGAPAQTSSSSLATQDLVALPIPPIENTSRQMMSNMMADSGWPASMIERACSQTATQLTSSLVPGGCGTWAASELRGNVTSGVFEAKSLGTHGSVSQFFLPDGTEIQEVKHKDGQRDYQGQRLDSSGNPKAVRIVPQYGEDENLLTYIDPRGCLISFDPQALSMTKVAEPRHPTDVCSESRAGAPAQTSSLPPATQNVIALHVPPVENTSRQMMSKMMADSGWPASMIERACSLAATQLTGSLVPAGCGIWAASELRGNVTSGVFEAKSLGTHGSVSQFSLPDGTEIQKIERNDGQRDYQGQRLDSSGNPMAVRIVPQYGEDENLLTYIDPRGCLISFDPQALSMTKVAEPRQRLV